jgi:hypothetical protein
MRQSLERGSGDSFRQIYRQGTRRRKVIGYLRLVIGEENEKAASSS